MPQGSGLAARPVLLGKDSRIRINGNPLGIRTGRFVVRAADHEVGDTEDGAFESHQPGRIVGEGNCEWYEINATSTTAMLIICDGIAQAATIAAGIAPYLTLIHLQVYRKGLALTAIDFPTFSILEWEDDIDINQPVSGKFSGKSSGTFTEPTS
jgi:hypothetical protein